VRLGNLTINLALKKNLIRFVIENKIDVVSIDPFIRTHRVNENDNGAISAVVEIYDEIADVAHCAIHLWHHTRKGGNGAVTIESARGAAAFVDVCRSVRILEPMTKEEATQLKLKRASSYFREIDGKHTFAPRSDESWWYQFISVPLNNAFDGDEVGVVAAWKHPGKAAQANLTGDKIRAIVREVAKGEWREDSRAAMWVGRAVAKVMGLDHEDDKATVRRLVKKLLTNGVLVTENRKDGYRNLKPFVVPGEAAAVDAAVEKTAAEGAAEGGAAVTSTAADYDGPECG
jgi:hypothetical protein